MVGRIGGRLVGIYRLLVRRHACLEALQEGSIAGFVGDFHGPFALLYLGLRGLAEGIALLRRALLARGEVYRGYCRLP